MFSERCRAHAAITLAILLTSVAGGCYSGSDMAPVHGVVSVDGEPVAGAAIAFRPETGGRPAWAITEEDGTYQLQTINPGDGALIGTHTVTITCFEEPPASAAGQADDEMASVFEADVRQPTQEMDRSKEVLGRGDFRAELRSACGTGKTRRNSNYSLKIRFRFLFSKVE